MYKSILAFAMIVAAVTTGPSSSARADGINLSWDDCGTYGVLNKDFACDDDITVFVLVGSWIRDAPDSLVSMLSYVSLDAVNTELPDWWKFDQGNQLPGVCQDSGAIHFDDGQSTSCSTLIPDPISGFGYSWGGSNGPRRASFTVGIASESISELFPVPETEYVAFRLSIRSHKTTGPEACAGCGVPMSIVLDKVVLLRLDSAGDHVITTPATRNVVTWQAGSVPTLKGTWGKIKSLYR